MAELALAVRALQASREPSEIAHHGSACCVLARAWLHCLDSSFHRGRARDAQPAWIARRWIAAATRAPLHWCEIPAARGLDSGASSALARELGRTLSLRVARPQDTILCWGEHRLAAGAWTALGAHGPGA